MALSEAVCRKVFDDAAKQSNLPCYDSAKFGVDVVGIVRALHSDLKEEGAEEDRYKALEHAISELRKGVAVALLESEEYNLLLPVEKVTEWANTICKVIIGRIKEMDKAIGQTNRLVQKLSEINTAEEIFRV